MAGMGPAPKDPAKRARRNKDAVQGRVIPFVGAPQPELPERVDKAGNVLPWHPETVEWWAVWGRSPLAADFTETDWASLKATALMHDAMWSNGRWEFASEIRLREAKFGATPEDRARLRITFANADEKDERGAARGVGESASRPAGKYAGLRLAASE